MMASYVRARLRRDAHLARSRRFSYWMDTFGLDSEYDYDPVWAKCVELGSPPPFIPWLTDGVAAPAPSNYLHNQPGQLRSSAEPSPRTLPRRGAKTLSATDLRLHGGGVAWARNLYCDLISHWEKRNREAVEN